MYTFFSAVLRQQRKSDAMTSFGHPVRSAVYYRALVIVNISKITWPILMRFAAHGRIFSWP
jgi:hypothetical protein